MGGGEYDIRNADGQKNVRTNGILVYIIRYECMHISLLKKGTLTYVYIVYAYCIERIEIKY